MVGLLAVIDTGPRRRAVSGADDIFDVPARRHGAGATASAARLITTKQRGREVAAAAERAERALRSPRRPLAAQKTARHPQCRLTISSVVQMTRLTSGGNARNGVNSSMKVAG
jgi:hypothetical protein